MTTSRINAYRWPARLVSHKPFAAERYFITSSCYLASVFCRKLRFFFFIFSVLSMAAFSVQDAQSQRFLPVENSPASPCSISMGGKGRGYTYIYRGNASLSQSFVQPSREGVIGCAMPAPPRGELSLAVHANFISLPKVSPLGRGGCERSEQTERATVAIPARSRQSSEGNKRRQAAASPLRPLPVKKQTGKARRLCRFANI